MQSTSPSILGNIAPVLRVSGPLMIAMSGHTVMMIVDRLCLAAYSEDTLIASGPAVFTAMIAITLFRGITHVGRATISEAFAEKQFTTAVTELGNLVLLGMLCATMFLAVVPVLILLNGFSARPDNILSLERIYLWWAMAFGVVMIFNNVGNCFFSAVLKTDLVLRANLVGQVIAVVLTYSLVFGEFGLPEMGMAGSAIGTLAGASTILVIYMSALPAGFRIAVARAIEDWRSNRGQTLWQRLRRGFSIGGEESADELGHTAILWANSILGTAALAANNFNIVLNYISIIPIIGIANGATVLCSHAIARREQERLTGIIAASLIVSLCWVLFVALTLHQSGQLVTGAFGLADYSDGVFALSVSVTGLIWLYAVGFSLSQVGGAVLQSLGNTAFIFKVRVALMWFGSVPMAFLLAAHGSVESGALQLIWVSIALFEFAIGIVFLLRVRVELLVGTPHIWRSRKGGFQSDD